MAALDPVVGNATNDALLLQNGASGSVATGTLTLTAPWTIHFSAVLGVAGTNGTDITGTATTTLAGKATTASASISNLPTKANTSAISITTTSAGTWNGLEAFDSTGTPKRVWFAPTSALGKAFASGDILSVPIGNATSTVS